MGREVIKRIKTQKELFRDFLTSRIGSPDYDLQPLTGDASSRRYYRVSLGDKSWVLMVWEAFTDPQIFPFLSTHGYFQHSGVRVPGLYDFSEKKGLFLIEDLGDLSLEKYVWNCITENSLLKTYTKVMDQLIRIHSLCFEEKHPEACTAYKQEFSVEKLFQELNFSKTHLFKGLLKTPMSTTEEKKLDREFRTLCERLYRSPQVICHRDFHSRNVMLTSDEVVIIDFQDARMGPVVYDLVSLFHDSYVSLDSTFTGYLMQYYKNHFPHFDKLQLDGEQWQDFFEQQTLQRCFKACGSFAFFTSFKKPGNNRSYLHYIQPTLSKILEKIKNRGHYPVWEKLLEKSKPQWEKL